MGIRVTGEIEGDKQLSVELGVASNRIKDFTKPLTEIESGLMKSFDLNFDQAGGVFQSGGWPERKPQYGGTISKLSVVSTDYNHLTGRYGRSFLRRETGRERTDTWPLLMKSGAMRSSFGSSISSTELIIQNFAPYFPYHQSNKPRTRLPRRVMMAIDAARQTFAIKTIQRHVVESTRGLR